MHIEEYDYYLPEALIAQEPLKERDMCRLLHLDRAAGHITHRHFRDIISLLKPGDRLVFNNTKVLPARLYCRKQTGGAVEFLFTERIDSLHWKAIVKPGRRMKAGSRVKIEPDSWLSVDDVLENGDRIISLEPSGSLSSIDELLERNGVMPLPHYINRDAQNEDRETYQTVYAEVPGAVAAPTAGLHFTSSLLHELAAKGIDSSFVTLHVGIGTFRPVKVDDPREHPMHEETYEIDDRTASAILETRSRGGRIIAVGTTVVRVLEHCAAVDGTLAGSSGRTRLLILPPYRFRIVDGLITNFHLPRSTLLMLVAAFAGKEQVLTAYNEAVKEKYRFYSYGDAMIIL